MKRIFVVIAFMLALSLLLCACAEKPKNPEGETEEETASPNGVTGIVSGFLGQYVRVSGSLDQWASEPRVRSFGSAAQFDRFAEVYLLDQEVQVSGEADIFSEQFVDFPMLLEKYNETFFEDYYLVLIQLYEESDTVRHRTVNVEVREVGSQSKLCVDIQRLKQPIDNPIGACWYLFLEVNRGDLVIGSSRDIYVNVED